MRVQRNWHMNRSRHWKSLKIRYVIRTCRMSHPNVRFAFHWYDRNPQLSMPLNAPSIDQKHFKESKHFQVHFERPWFIAMLPLAVPNFIWTKEISSHSRNPDGPYQPGTNPFKISSQGHDERQKERTDDWIEGGPDDGTRYSLLLRFIGGRLVSGASCLAFEVEATLSPAFDGLSGAWSDNHVRRFIDDLPLSHEPFEIMAPSMFMVIVWSDASCFSEICFLICLKTMVYSTRSTCFIVMSWSWLAVCCFSRTFLVIRLNDVGTASAFTAACPFEGSFLVFVFKAEVPSDGEGYLLHNLISLSGVLSIASFVCSGQGVFRSRCPIVSYHVVIATQMLVVHGQHC